MTQGGGGLTSEDGKDDTGYYTPKNILNPAMFRLAEITRALSEVNMEIEQEKLFDDRRHTINVEEYSHEEDSDNRSECEIQDIGEGSFKVEPKVRKGWSGAFHQHEDTIARGLLICMGISIALLLVLLVVWS